MLVSNSRRACCVAVATVALALASQAAVAQSTQLLRFDGGRDDRAHALVTDATGSVYVGGASESATSPTQFVVVEHTGTC